MGKPSCSWTEWWHNTNLCWSTFSPRSYKPPGFWGIEIAKKNRDINSSFTVRKISFGEGVERTFALYSPNVDSIKVIRSGKVRRAKLYYLRDRKGKSARIAEKIKKKIGVDVSVKPEEPKVKPIEPATQETKVEEVKKEAPKVKAKAEKLTSEKK